ncbi:nuclear protein AMMECR1 [Adelges cooleyi]|uniref:nuclear protein AMMECR1 n=1 Tax=Adelges cooleyi TaxID=133065 RepID=UPI00217F4523|nr:nuclear protein AMMECR1 [Adelges cooleyi]
MSSGCCGTNTKKQKLNHHHQVSLDVNGGSGSASTAPLDGPVEKITSPEMGYFCFDTLYSYLNSLEPPKNPDFTNDPFPLFVTWEIGKDKKLRGCIGTFNSIALHSGLREYAITSAMKDSRFRPISNDEINRLHVTVSILLHFEEGKDFNDWEIGVHGIRIEFHNERGMRRTATYLPEVPEEQGWDKIQTIDSLLRKGGYRGPVTAETRRSLKLTRYQSETVSVSYQDYMSHLQTVRC